MKTFYAEYQVEAQDGVYRAIEAVTLEGAKIMAEKYEFAASTMTGRAWKLVTVHEAFPASHRLGMEEIDTDYEIARRMEKGRARRASKGG